MQDKIRIVRQVGNSMSLTMPKDCGLSLGEYVRIKKDGDMIIITKVD